MKKRIGDVKEFEFCNVGEKSPSLRTVVAVTGWLKGDKLEKGTIMSLSKSVFPKWLSKLPLVRPTLHWLEAWYL